MALDTNCIVWTFSDWAEPTRLVSPSLDCSSPETTPIQIDCGQTFSVVLTRSGDVYAWWADAGTFRELYLETHDPTMGLIADHEGVIHCQTLELKMDPIKLPTLPDLPDLLATGLSEEEHRKETKLIKIAACDDCLIGLTNKGHVLKLDELDNEEYTRIWRYVSENACVLMTFLKLWCAAAKLL